MSMDKNTQALRDFPRLISQLKANCFSVSHQGNWIHSRNRNYELLEDFNNVDSPVFTVYANGGTFRFHFVDDGFGFESVFDPDITPSMAYDLLESFKSDLPF